MSSLAAATPHGRRVPRGSPVPHGRGRAATEASYVTFAYVIIVPDGTPIIAGGDARTARWWPLKDVPEQLAFDHADIISAAVAPNS